MSQAKNLDQVPVLHVRGTNYEVGFAIGRTFMSLITDFLDQWADFRATLLPAYETSGGKNIYEKSLARCKARFPHYVKEIEGMADGAKIPFHEIFLLHIEAFILKGNLDPPQNDNEGLKGCTDILCNNEELGLAHTEDALAQMANNFFIVYAHIVDEQGGSLEEWTSLTYPGYLPGYTMGYNRHGIVHSVNTILPANFFVDRTPVHFITRGLLGAKDREDVLRILKDGGSGIGDSFSLNIIFAQENPPTVQNIEVGPNQNGGTESEIDIFDVENGNSHAHCNKYLRLKVPEVGGQSWKSSLRRHETIKNFGLPTTLEGIRSVLSDPKIYRTPGVIFDGVAEYAATICVGVFDVKNRTWSIYTKPPKESAPVAVLSMHF